ncbi:MAG: STAS-like domain-containing protein [Methanosarcinaceae archaeon]|nr:STAS-like domain-containing protein [Methanosarcinaceae archaeon]
MASGDGQRVFKKITETFHTNKKVELSFLDVTDLTAAFLNAAIVQLYGKFSEEFIRQNLAVAELEKEDRIIIKRVVERARNYFNNPVPYRQAVRDVIEDDDC